MTIDDLKSYYANLLILQYIGKPKAYATIKAAVDGFVMPLWTQQNIAFSAVAASGSFVINYGTDSTSAIPWNALAADIQAALNSISVLKNAVVSGSVVGQSVNILFVDVPPQASAVTISSNTLQTSGAVAITTAVTTPFRGDNAQTLPMAVQNAFTLGTAVGKQLDIIGKYVGVSRNGYDFSGPVTLGDSDFTLLIKIAIILNSSGSSLSDIQNLLSIFFNGVIQVFDHADMSMDYFFDSSVGSDVLAEFFVKGGFLPKPMGVQLGTLVYASPINNFFGWRTMILPPFQTHGFNTMAQYDTGCPWLFMGNGIAQ